MRWATIQTARRRRSLTIRSETGHKERVMADATVANQRQILANQRTILANQKSILTNQKRIQGNQAKILANQKRILARLR